MAKDHETLTASQFGAHAQAYVASSVHAWGDDLEAIAALAAREKPARALDLGTGGGHVAYKLAQAARAVVAVDLSADMLASVTAEAKRRRLGNIETAQASAEKLPFRDADFDFLASRFSAHHWRDARQGLSEARRVLRSGAPAFFIDIVGPREVAFDTHLQTVELLRDASHVRNASLVEWTSTLTSLGFDVGQVTKYRVRLEFKSWIERMNTPETHVAAIRSLQHRAAATVTDYFEIEKDGSFTIDTALIVAHKA